MSEHTPPPWEFDGDNPMNQGFDIAFPEGGTLATAYYCVDGEGRATAEANARLIAAAPELYDALRQVVVTSAGRPEEHSRAIEEAIAVLARLSGHRTPFDRAEER